MIYSFRLFAGGKRGPARALYPSDRTIELVSVVPVGMPFTR